ncbi:TolC family outer membrane protein [Paracoccaceae bacterium GXU_MW_L88]
MTVFRSLTVAAAIVIAAPVQAETLGDALVAAYRNSNDLKTARAELRSVDENVAQARAAKRPQVSAQGRAALAASDNAPVHLTDSYSVSLNASLNLFDSGRTEAAIEAAKELVLSQRASLVQVEQSVLLGAAQAYFEVLRAQSLVALAENSRGVLSQQLQAAQDRFSVGEITRSDVSLAQASLAEAESNVAAQGGTLQTAINAYILATGTRPGDLAAAPPTPEMPASLEAAQQIAMQRHPSIVAARYAERSSQWDLRRAERGGRPSVDVNASVGYEDSESAATGERSSDQVGSVSVTGTVPLYQGGQIDSLRRQAQAALDARRSELQSAAQTVRQNVADSWSQLTVSRAAIAANSQQVTAAQEAFDSVSEEAALGARTTLDVLDSQQDLLDAQTSLANSRRNQEIAHYALLTAMGLMTADHLGLRVERYDPNINYGRVQNAPLSTFDGTIVEKLRDRF